VKANASQQVLFTPKDPDATGTPSRKFDVPSTFNALKIPDPFDDWGFPLTKYPRI